MSTKSEKKANSAEAKKVQKTTKSLHGAALFGGFDWKGQFFLKSDHKKCSKEGENMFVWLICHFPHKLQPIFEVKGCNQRQGKEQYLPILKGHRPENSE